MKLSIVMTFSDSFDLTGSLVEMIDMTLKNVFSFSNDKNIEVEIILVNWNSMVEKCTCQKLNLSSKPANISVVCIEVSNSIHNSYNLSHKIPYYVAHAVNIGIRRAKADVVLTMKAGVFFTKDIWQSIYNHVLQNNYKDTFLILSSKAILSNFLLQKDEKIYQYSLQYIKQYFLKELNGKELIDYEYKRKCLNRTQGFRLFDSFVFSKVHAENIAGYPELSVYPGTLTEKFFVENMKNIYKNSLTLEAGCKFYYKEKNHINPMDDNELRLVQGTEKIIINRIKKEKNPVIFNNENWGLRDIELKCIQLKI